MANRVRTVVGLIGAQLPMLVESVQHQREQDRRDGILIGLARVEVLTHRERVAIFEDLTGKTMRPQHFPLEARKAHDRKI